MDGKKAEILAFWNDRSSLGYAAGSGDTNLKDLELTAISSLISGPGRVLDAGCGNGYALCKIAKTVSGLRLYGFDYSEGMVRESSDLVARESLKGKVNIIQGDLLNVEKLQWPDNFTGQFEHVYTERSLINLDTKEDQRSAVQSLWRLVAPGGQLILCEAFKNGLDEINVFRAAVGLSKISPPWHNRYLELEDIESLLPDCKTFEIKEFSGSYYFVSRVINAALAKKRNEEPSYDDDMNIISLSVPPIPVCGQSKIIVFSKE